MSSQPDRATLGGTAAGLLLLGAFFLQVLVADSSDNAYFYLFALGMALLIAALPFVLAALMPGGAPRRMTARLALGFLSVVGLPGLVLLIFAVLLIPFQNYESSQVLVSHVLGLVLLLAALIAMIFLYRRRM